MHLLFVWYSSHYGTAFQYETTDKSGVNIAGECIRALPCLVDLPVAALERRR